MNVPGGANVNRSLVALKKNVRGCLRQINQQAGKLLSKGNYAGAESLVEVAKSVDAFRAEVASLQARWKEIKGVRVGSARPEQTLLWEYYQPILGAIVDLGGSAKIGELEAAVGARIDGRLLPGDLEAMAGGRARWQVMIRRARKHMVKERFLEADSGLEWRATAAGRKAAASGKVR